MRQCLVDTELAHLRVIARLWGLDVKATRRLEIAAELAGLLADPGHAEDTWDTMPEDERAALKALLDAGGQISAAAFARRFGEIRPIGPGRMERETPWRDPIGPAEGLWYRGLIYEGFAEEGSESYPVYFIPAELEAALPVKSKWVGHAIQLEPVAPPALSRLGSDCLLSDLTTLLSFVHNNVVRPVGESTSSWPREMMRSVTRFLRDATAERLEFILRLIDHLGWIRVSDERRLLLSGEPVMAWLQQPAEESLRVLIDGWREMRNWDELWQLTPLKPDDAMTRRTDPTLARAALLRHLEVLKSAEWMGVTDLISAIKAADPDFLRPAGDYEEWYVRDTASGEYLSGFESWDQVEGALLRALLMGPAMWLGLVELGVDAGGIVSDVFRPVPRPGARAGPSLAPTAETLSPTIRADLTLTMPARLRWESFQLARVADLTKVGDPYVYRLSPASLGRARKQHIGVNRILSFLDSLSDAPLLQAVRSSLMRWYERGTEVWLERTVLLRVADEVVMQQILGASEAGRYIVRAVGPTAAIVAEKDWPSLVLAMAELGLLVELVGFQDVA